MDCNPNVLVVFVPGTASRNLEIPVYMDENKRQCWHKGSFFAPMPDLFCGLGSVSVTDKAWNGCGKNN